jgi:hypothetical protein
MKADKGESETRDRFLADVTSDIQNNGNDYISVIQSLRLETKKNGIDWLQSIVDGTLVNILNTLTNFK